MNMKKNLRMLCMGLAAAATSMAFAQEPQNYTEKLWNNDFEKGPNGWDLVAEGNCSWMSQTKGEKIAAGYYGFNNLALENWRGSGTAPDNQVSQTVKNLPDGTYVFGAYMMATTQSREQDRETVEGVYMFANEEEISVATNRVEGMDVKWAHTIKFNVAAEVKDGTLTVGVKCVGTNAGFLAMDNATLWYFGDMDKAAALDEMAKIDMAASVAIADTCKALKMPADTLAYLNQTIEAALAVTDDVDAIQADEDIWWAMRLAKKCDAKYKSLAEAIEAAKEVAAQEWSDEKETVAALEALNALITEAEAAYENGTYSCDDIETCKANLAEAAAVVQLDGIYTLIDVYREKIDSITDLQGDSIGNYTSDMVDAAEEAMSRIEDELALIGEEGVSALEVKTNCEKLYAEIQKIIDNPVNYSQFPIFIYEDDELLPNQGTGESNQAYPVLEGTYLVNYEAGQDKAGNAYGAKSNIAEYHSPLYRFREPLKSVRFIIHKSGKPGQVDKNGNANICVGAFAMYDEHGNEIELTTENLTSNANEPREGGGIPALIDGNPNTFFHSLWTSGTPEPHYLEVTLPEGEYSAFSFSITSLSSNHTRAFPREMEITYVSPKVTELQQAIVTARKANPLFGTAPGFYNMDPTRFMTILEEGDALTQKKGATDEELDAAIEKVNNILAEIQEMGLNMPEPEKKYRIVSGEPRFFTNQNIMKTLTVHTDTIYGDWLWWETAHPDSAQQEFTLEFLEEKDSKLYYAIKNVKHNLYLSELYDTAGVLVQNRFVFSERRDSFVLKSLGQGQFGILAEGNSRQQLNMEFHNNGVASDVVANYGAIKGVTSYIHTWGSNANESSAWFFREMSTLPHAAKSISDLNFRSEAISIYEGINVVTLTADKECAFADLKVYNTFGQEVAMDEVTVDGKVATIKLASNIETLAFSFTNTEGVTTVSLDGINEYRGEAPELLALEAAYTKAAAIAPVEGTEVGQVKSVKEYDAAIAAAAALLENGGEAAEYVAATTALENAVANLECNLPVAGQNYYLISALPWNEKWRADVAVFAKDNYLYWGFVNLNNRTMLWQFVDCGEKKHGYPAYYLYNVGSEAWLSVHSAHLALVTDTTAQAARPWDMRMMANGAVSMGDTNWDNGAASMCPVGHSNGTAYPAQNKMSTWGIKDAPVACSWYVVTEEKFIADFMTGIENLDIVDEYVAPAAKGIYDLYGRRIETPATTGIYIVDGKKRVIKK